MTLSILLLLMMAMIVLTGATIEVVVLRPLRASDDPTQLRNYSRGNISSSISGAGSSSSSKVHGHSTAPCVESFIFLDKLFVVVRSSARLSSTDMYEYYEVYYESANTHTHTHTLIVSLNQSSIAHGNYPP